MRPDQTTDLLEWIIERLSPAQCTSGIPALGGRNVRQALMDGDVAQVLRQLVVSVEVDDDLEVDVELRGHAGRWEVRNR